jgi:hypothetical protein
MAQVGSRLGLLAIVLEANALEEMEDRKVKGYGTASVDDEIVKVEGNVYK